MSLIVPRGPQWAYYTDNYPATPSTSAFGTAVTAGANDTMGTAVEALDTIAHDCEYLEITISGFNANATAHQVLLDILVDPAGGTSWSVLISGLLCGYTVASATTIPRACFYNFPLWIPAGTSIGLQAQTHHSATDAGNVTIAIQGGNSNPASWWCGQGVETIGVDTASSQGTLVTPGNTGAFSSWVDLGAPTTTTRDGGAIQTGVQSNGTDVAGRAFRIEFGAGDNRIGPARHLITGTTEAGWTHNSGPVFRSIRAGTQLQARGTANTTNTDALGCAAYLVY